MNPPPADLSPSAEASWQTLRQHAEWARGAWLVWLFTDEDRVRAALRERLGGLSVGGLRLLELRGPDDVDGLLRTLLTERPSSLHTWLQATGSSPAVRQAWIRLHLRLNERRERLRAHLPGGLVLAAPLAWKADTRNAAPDLWSVRSLVLEPEAQVVGRLSREPADSSVRARPDHPPEDRELAELGLKRALAAQNPQAEAVARTRLARALLDQGEVGEAREHAALAVAVAPEGRVKARALATLAETEETLGDPVAAEAHLGQALAHTGEGGGAEAAWWAIRRAVLLGQAWRWEEALVVAQEAVRRARGATEEDDRALPGALVEVGRALGQLGNLAEARDAYTESLSLARARHEALGDQPEVLRDLSVSLERLGDIEQELGNLTNAREAFAEGLAHCRTLREVLGDQAEVLRDLSVCLNRLGDIERRLGHLSAAREAWSDSLTQCRTLREALGDEPDVLRDLSVSLNRLGTIEHDLGRLTESRQSCAESLAIFRTLREALGDQPGVLHDLSGSLMRLGDIERDLGHIVEAREAFAESLALRRNLHQVLGDQPGILRDLSVGLGHLAMVSEAEDAAHLATECLSVAQAAHAQAPQPGDEALLTWARGLLPSPPAE